MASAAPRGATVKLAVLCAMGRDNGRMLRAALLGQTFRDVAIIVAENRAGIGACERAGIKPTQLIRHQGEPSIGAIRNALLDTAEAAGATHWVTMDDDDWYGPGYLAEAASALASHDAIGKVAHFTKLANGQVVFFSSGDGEIVTDQEVTRAVQGPTMGAVVSRDMPRFNEHTKWGEDTDWAESVVGAGVRMWATSPWHYCYLRHGQQHRHTYPARDRHVLSYSRGDLFDVGAWGRSARRLIGSGSLVELRARMVPRQRPELDPEDSP